MSWIVRNLDKLITILSTVFEQIVQIWGIFRAVVVTALVLYTIIINIHQQIDNKCEVTTYENYTSIDYALCYHLECGGGCNP